MSEERYKDREWLEEQYVHKEKTDKEIAQIVGMSPPTITYWRDKFDIEGGKSDPRPNAPYREKDTLKRLFYDEGQSRDEIADKFDITRGTVNTWLSNHGLQPETQARKTGRIQTIGNGYVQFIDYNGPDDKERVYIHRLLAVAEYGFDTVCQNQIHHKNEVAFDNRPSNIELMDIQEHASYHSTQRAKEHGEKIRQLWEEGAYDDRGE